MPTVQKPRCNNRSATIKHVWDTAASLDAVPVFGFQRRRSGGARCRPSLPWRGKPRYPLREGFPGFISSH